MRKLKKYTIISILITIFNVIITQSVFAETYNNYSSGVVSCGNNIMNNIPASIPRVISILYTMIQIVVPVLLVVFGMIDLIKGIMASKEDEIKKGQQVFIKRLIAAAIVFFVFVVVKLVVSFAADSSNSSNIMDCVECFIKNDCDSQNLGGSSVP